MYATPYTAEYIYLLWLDKTQETNSDFDLSTIVICAKGGGYQSWYHVPGGPNETAPSATLCPANGIGVLGWFQGGGVLRSRCSPWLGTLWWLPNPAPGNISVLHRTDRDQACTVLYTQFRLYGLRIYGLFAYMDNFIPIFRLYGLPFYGLFAYMDHFSRDKCGPYIRNWVYHLKLDQCQL